MCGSTNNGGNSGGKKSKPSWGGLYHDSTGAWNPAGALRERAGGGTQSADAPAPVAPQPPAAMAPVQAPLGAPQSRKPMTAVFGVNGVGAKEDEEALKGGTISAPEGMSWDFETGKFKGGAPKWSPSRGAGAVVDMAQGGVDRTMTPARALKAKAAGELKTVAERLKSGDLRYEGDKLVPDKAGAALDLGGTVISFLSGPVGMATAGAKLIGKAKDFSDLRAAGLLDPLSGKPVGGRVNDNQARPGQLAAADEDAKQPVKAPIRKPRKTNGKAQLLKTGARGLDDSLPLAF